MLLFISHKVLPVLFGNEAKVKVALLYLSRVEVLFLLITKYGKCSVLLLVTK